MFTSARAGLAGHRRRAAAMPVLLPFAALAVLLSGGESSLADTPAERPTVIVAVGAPGEEEFGQGFAQWAGLLEKASHQAGGKEIIIGLQTTNAALDRDLLQQALAHEPKDGAAELWVVLIGHGTFDGKEAKFNLRSNDVSAVELAEWLQPFRRPVAIINASSASAPFLQKLSGTNRVVITATRSGSEVNFARFGRYFSAAIADPAADLDKDGQTSLLEAYLMAARRVKEFYETEGRLATEHALLDDNGDGLGTPPDWFRGIRAVKSAKDGAALDGLRAHQFHLVRSEAELKLPPEVRARRDALEQSIAKLRDSKRTLAEDDYYQKLEVLLLEIARLYEGAGPAP
jgi:mannose-6-phosphate isomerase-like protein (cupin superfamily)